MKMFFRFVPYLSLGVCIGVLPLAAVDESAPLLEKRGQHSFFLSPVHPRSYSTARSYSMATTQDSFSAPSELLRQKARGDYETLCDLALFYSDKRSSVAQKNGHLSESQLEMKLKANALSAVKENNLSKVMQGIIRFLDQANAYLTDEKLSEGTQGVDKLGALRKKAADQCNKLYDLAKFYNSAGKARLLGKYSDQGEEDVEKLLQAEALNAVEEGAVLILLDNLNQSATTAEAILIRAEEQRRSVSQQPNFGSLNSVQDPPMEPVTRVDLETTPSGTQPASSQNQIPRNATRQGCPCVIA